MFFPISEEDEIYAEFSNLSECKELYLAIKQLHLKGNARDQLERAALSIATNLAEGSGKEGKDRKRYFQIAMGSLRETQALLEIIGNECCQRQADKLGANLYCLLRNPGP